MFDFLKRKGSKDAPPPSSQDNTYNTPSTQDKGFLDRLKSAIKRTSQFFTSGLTRLISSKPYIDEELLESLEELLLRSDVGITVTESIIANLKAEVKGQGNIPSDQLVEMLKAQLIKRLSPYEQPLVVADSKPFLLLMVGVNGTGKTTTIGKLAKRFQNQNKTVLLAAGDTFRAAAVEQLKIWGERNQIPVIAQQTGADSASVIFDAFQGAKAREVDILIADTAGRLHTQSHLMEELKKIVRVIQKIDPKAPHEVMLVLDASIGQNALVQAQKFHEAIKVSGITLTKLDGTAKGGIIFNIAETLKLPIRFIGVGEGIEDLRPFNAAEFVEAFFSEEHIHA